MGADLLIRKMRASTHNNNFYHFTDGSNIESIKKYGLLSLSEQTRNKITPNNYGSDELSRSQDIRSEMDRYVHLSFWKSNSMQFKAKAEGRIKDFILLKISPLVANTHGALFSTEFSNSHSAKILKIEEAIEHIDMEVLYTNTPWKDSAIQTRIRTVEKYELLIPLRIPPEMISLP